MKRVADGAVRSASISRAARAMSYLAADPMRQPVIVSAVRTPIGRCACISRTGSGVRGVRGRFVSTSSLHGVCGMQTSEPAPRDTARICISARVSKVFPICGAPFRVCHSFGGSLAGVKAPQLGAAAIKGYVLLCIFPLLFLRDRYTAAQYNTFRMS